MTSTKQDFWNCGEFQMPDIAAFVSENVVDAIQSEYDDLQCSLSSPSTGLEVFVYGSDRPIGEDGVNDIFHRRFNLRAMVESLAEDLAGTDEAEGIAAEFEAMAARFRPGGRDRG